MINSSLCTVLLLLCISLLSARYSDNLFLQTCRLAAAELNETNCWVCARMPTHQGASFPLQAVPANLTDLFSDHPGRSTQQPEAPVLDVNHEATFPVCFQWPARPGVTELGVTSRCQTNISLFATDPITISGPLPAELLPPANFSFSSSSPSPRMYPLLTAACRVWKKPFAACLSLQPWEAQEEYFWICGRRAYKQLPSVWSGSCALGHVVPAIRVTKGRPAGSIRNIRDLQQSRDIVNTYQPLTDWDLYLSAVLPMMGTVRVGWAVYRLQAIMELLTNDTAETFNLIATEQRELRKLALQNRMALDMILASHGGVCALIGSECCVFVPDVSQEVFDHSKHIVSLGAMDKDISHEWISELKEWLGTWWGKVISYVIGVLVLVVVIVLILKCLFSIVISMCRKQERLMVNVNLTVYEDNPEEEVEAIADMYQINID